MVANTQCSIRRSDDESGRFYFSSMGFETGKCAKSDFALIKVNEAGFQEDLRI